MLKSHMDAKEQALVAISRIPANAGHPLHKGTPREAFIREFLESHLPANVALGTGEIIDSHSSPNTPRNQFDIVIYKRSYPKLDFGGGISGFLVESVIATIEVKSTLTQVDLENAVEAAKRSKSLAPHLTTVMKAGYIPPKVLNYVIAYDGPANMSTVYGWLRAIHANLGVQTPGIPVEASQRIMTPSPSVDGIFVLQKGFVYFDNVPVGIVSDTVRQEHPGIKWAICDTSTGNLLLFFLFLQMATANIEGRWLDPCPYLQNAQFLNVKLGYGID